MSNVPSELRYSAEHEWIDSSSPAKIGITQHAADALGEVVYVELPEVGATVTAGEVCGEVESTKSVSELYSPVTGEVVAVNEVIVDDTARINEDPYGEGWLFQVEVTEEGPLMTADEYVAATA